MGRGRGTGKREWGGERERDKRETIRNLGRINKWETEYDSRRQTDRHTDRQLGTSQTPE